MGIRVFAKRKGLELVSDERDVMVSHFLVNDVVQWCDHLGISAEQVSTQPIVQWKFGVNLWRVKDDKQRVLFALRWA